MTLTPQKTTIEPLTSSVSPPQSDCQLDWKNCWYPITFVQDFPKSRPYGFTLYDEPFVLFVNKQGKLVCLQDICPHRAAKLSDGQILDGNLECLYHGWQFNDEGKCVHIPQLPDDTPIPKNACITSFFVVQKQGIIWFWRGKKEEADETRIPTIANLDKRDMMVTDCMIDLPYDQTYLIENVVDPAHVHISHHGSLGNRKNAQPLTMEVKEKSIEGIKSVYKYAKTAAMGWITLDFIAPNLVMYEFTLPNQLMGGTALYSLPSGKGSCRLLLRNYSNIPNWKARLKPRWLLHLGSNRILEEDSVFIMAEQSILEKSKQTMQDLILPLKTSDLLVVEYRKWLDTFGKALPFYQGYTTAKSSPKTGENSQTKVTLDRFKQHTQICHSCRQTYQRIIITQKVLIAVAILLAACAILTDGTKLEIISILLSLFSLIIAVGLGVLKAKFEQPYTRP